MLYSAKASWRIRTNAIVTFLTYIKVRVSEVLDIKMTDANLQTGECMIRNEKEGKQRIVLLNSKVIRAIKDYLRGVATSPSSQEKKLPQKRKNDLHYKERYQKGPNIPALFR
ncbi:tyrosine-type recombinase/integrase [Microbacteriaceae bacterium 4G12]